VAAEIGRIEITAATGWNTPPQAEIWMKEAASGCGDRTNRNYSSHWLEYSAAGGNSDEKGSQWLRR